MSSRGSRKFFFGHVTKLSIECQAANVSLEGDQVMTQFKVFFFFFFFCEPFQE